MPIVIKYILSQYEEWTENSSQLQKNVLKEERLEPLKTKNFVLKCSKRKIRENRILKYEKNLI
jgi:hypothetical protein